MKINISAKDIPFSSLQILYAFEEEVCEKIKELLNSQFPHISIKMNMVLNGWEGNPVRVRHNANDLIEGSVVLIDNLNSYLSTRDDIGNILTNQYSLVIDLLFQKKKVSPQTNNEKKEEEKVVDFFPVKAKYNFDQIILDDNIRKEIFDAVKVIECKDLIYDKWGFSEVDPVPRSILNFYGEPGTGKTMCAHAIANYLGKDILALNYSEIESKYVGEAPKNLQKAFDVAKEQDAVLFFDEADSFLGKRIENVTQGADQALNSLRSQMLIQLEEFSGVVLFATNLVTNFDPAFESRILKHIRFELPNLEARAAIIKKMIPSRLPILSPFTDEQYLEASALIDGFSGREIKGAILDLILSKADINNSDIVFTIKDLYDTLRKKQEAKKELKAEEERRIKSKIEKKLKEKAAEAEALKKVDEQNTVDQTSEELSLDAQSLNESDKSSDIQQEESSGDNKELQ